jgi:two-component system NtrC family sensor kinase
MVTYDAYALRRSLENEMTTTVDMVARSTKAALSFQDSKAAEEALQTLRAKPSISMAYVMDASGQIVATYQSDPEQAFVAAPGKAETGKRYDKGYLVSWQSISDSSGKLGTIVIQSSLGELRSHTSAFVRLAALVTALSCLAAVLISSRLQRQVSRHIHSLAELASTFQQGGDRAQHAVKEANDETGALVDAFNGMLDRIQERDLSLARYHDELEDLVKERTDQLERSQEDLRRSERLATVGTLAAGVAHQINNPVGAILNSAQFALLCEGDSDEHETWREALVINIEQARRCGKIVRGILQFSRADQLEKSRGILEAVVVRSVRLCEDYAREKEVSLNCSADGVSQVLMSSIDIEQVVVNLVRNAIEASTQGLGSVHVEVAQQQDTVYIDIRDNGSGITEKDRGRVFDPFFTTRLHENGTGLGLSLSHTIVLNHQGVIRLESEVGVGSMFTVCLPLFESDREAPTPGPFELGIS